MTVHDFLGEDPIRTLSIRPLREHVQKLNMFTLYLFTVHYIISVVSKEHLRFYAAVAFCLTGFFWTLTSGQKVYVPVPHFSAITYANVTFS